MNATKETQTASRIHGCSEMPTGRASRHRRQDNWASETELLGEACFQHGALLVGVVVRVRRAVSQQFSSRQSVSELFSPSHAARCVACHGVRSHAVPVALVGECSMPVV